MIYVLYGIEDILIEKELERLIKEKNIENIVKYDLKETSIESILEDASYIDLFNNEKAIIVYNSLFLTSSDSVETDALEKYIVNQNEKSIIFFIVNSEKLDERKKIVKLIKKNSTILEFNKINNYNIEKYIKNSFEQDGYNIGLNSIKRILNLLGNNFKLVDKEIEKLKLYKIEDKNINIEDIEKTVTNVPEDDIFKLVEAVVNKDKESIFKIYKDLVNLGEEPIKIVIMLANQFRLLYQVKILYEDGKDKNEIASYLKVHPYRISLALDKIRNYKEEKLLNILESLADIDKEIKTGISDKTRALEIFFLEI